MTKKLTSTIILGTSLFSALAFSPVNAAAETEASLQDRISDLVSKESNTQADLKNAEEEIRANEKKLDELADQLKASQAQEVKLGKEIALLEENIEDRKDHLSDQLRSIQIDGNIGNYIEFIIEAESFSDTIGRIQVVSDIISANRNVMAEQKADRDAVAEKKDQTEKEIEKQLASVEELENLSQTLAQQKADKEVLVAQLAIERAGAEADLASLVAQREAAEAQAREIARLQAQAAEEELRESQDINKNPDLAVATATASNQNQASGQSSAEKTRLNTASADQDTTSQATSSQTASEASQPAKTEAKASAPATKTASTAPAQPVSTPAPQPAPRATTSFVRPTGGPVTSPYGYRIHPITGRHTHHNGIDFGGGGGIVAAQSGTVTVNSYDSGWGNYVKIDHGNGLQTLYAHLSSANVSVGQTVSAGQQIGIMGTTGMSTGVHLHFEVYRNGATVNPAPYLGM